MSDIDKMWGVEPPYTYWTNMRKCLESQGKCVPARIKVSCAMEQPQANRLEYERLAKSFRPVVEEKP